MPTMKPDSIATPLRRVCRASALLAATVLAACTTQDAYQAGQAWQKQQCAKLQDSAERTRCEQSAAVSWERYRAEAEAAKQPTSK
jgi:hypothetical protein